MLSNLLFNQQPPITQPFACQTFMSILSGTILLLAVGFALTVALQLFFRRHYFSPNTLSLLVTLAGILLTLHVTVHAPMAVVNKFNEDGCLSSGVICIILFNMALVCIAVFFSFQSYRFIRAGTQYHQLQLQGDRQSMSCEQVEALMEDVEVEDSL